MIRILPDSIAETWEQTMRNDAVDSIRYSLMWPSTPVKKLTKWGKFKNKVSRVFSYRIKIYSKDDNYCDCEEW